MIRYENIYDKYWYIFPLEDYINNYKKSREYLQKKKHELYIQKIKDEELLKNKEDKKEYKKEYKKEDKKEDKPKKRDLINFKNDDNDIFNLLDEIIKRNKK